MSSCTCLSTSSVFSWGKSLPEGKVGGREGGFIDTLVDHFFPIH